MCPTSPDTTVVLTVGAGFQVAIKKGKDAGVAVLHRVQGNVGGPVLEGIQRCVGQRNVAQTQLQSSLYTRLHTRINSKPAPLPSAPPKAFI